MLNHTRWRLFPKHLLDLLEDYLPTTASDLFNPQELSEGGRGDIVASLVHGDVNPSNILGTEPLPSFYSGWKTTFNSMAASSGGSSGSDTFKYFARRREAKMAAAATSTSDGEVPGPALIIHPIRGPGSQLIRSTDSTFIPFTRSLGLLPASTTDTTTDTTTDITATAAPQSLRRHSSTSQEPISPPTFKPTTMIDFGDALVQSDPLIDYISVFVTILNGRRDSPEILEVLLKSWRQCCQAHHKACGTHPQQQQQQQTEGVAGGTDVGTGAAVISLARRCMWHVLLWPSEGLAIHLTHCVPEIGEMNTWEEVEQALFGWWSSL
jgi:hypothetical protein